MPLPLSWSSPFELVSANLEVSADLQVSADLFSCQISGHHSTSLPWNTLNIIETPHGPWWATPWCWHLPPGAVRRLRADVQATVHATQLLEAHLANGPRMAILLQPMGSVNHYYPLWMVIGLWLQPCHNMLAYIYIYVLYVQIMHAYAMST